MPGQHEPVLPQSGRRNVLITSALPYVNNVPHLGNIIGSVLSADVFARFCRGRGINTLYVCGTDEYGTTTEARALAEDCSPRELCDKYHLIHAAIYAWFNISFDVFGRTTTAQHTEITQSIFRKLDTQGYLRERETTQLYCSQHHAFLADRFVEGQCPVCAFEDARGDQCDKCGSLLDPLDLQKPRCKLDGVTPITRDTKHIFFELDRLQPQLETFFKLSADKGAWSSNSRDITSSWLKKGLKPRSITRDLKWGTPVPRDGYDNKVIYPWFDACIGYISITANYTTEWRKWWCSPDEVELYQFLGKDNVPFHSVIFPATLIATGDAWTKVHHLAATEYLTYEGGKFSKSRGVGVFGDSAQQTGVASDVWRYYLLAQRPETGDSEFNWDSFIAANNNILLKNLGNLVSRVIKFLNSKHYDGVIPDFTQHVDATIDSWIEGVNVLLRQYLQQMEAVKLRAALATALHMSQQGNLFLQSQGLDNKLAELQPAKCAAVVGRSANLLLLLSAVLSPFMPDTATAILKQLNCDAPLIPSQWSADTLRPGYQIGQAAYLFRLIKADKAAEWRRAYGEGKDETSQLGKKVEKLRLKKGSSNGNTGPSNGNTGS